MADIAGRNGLCLCLRQHICPQGDYQAASVDARIDGWGREEEWGQNPMNCLRPFTPSTGEERTGLPVSSARRPSMRSIENVRILGPLRKASQVEISVTDSYVLKVKPPVRESGNIAGSAPITIVGPKGILTLKEGCIIANRHIHMSPADAAHFGVKDGDVIDVDAFSGSKRTRWFDVQIRVSDKFRLEMHVDTDDANAVGLKNGSTVTVVRA